MVGRRLRLSRGKRLTSFLSLQPGLHGVLGKEPPASDQNAPGHVLSARELVANGPGLQTEGMGELLDRVQRFHDGIFDAGLGPQSLPR